MSWVMASFCSCSHIQSFIDFGLLLVKTMRNWEWFYQFGWKSLLPFVSVFRFHSKSHDVQVFMIFFSMLFRGAKMSNKTRKQKRLFSQCICYFLRYWSILFFLCVSVGKTFNEWHFQSFKSHFFVALVFVLCFATCYLLFESIDTTMQLSPCPVLLKSVIKILSCPEEDLARCFISPAQGGRS